MAPNGSTSRKTPVAPPKAIENGDSFFMDDLFDDLNDTTAELKTSVRKELPILEKPGNWDSPVAGGAKSKNSNGCTSPSVNTIPSNIAKAFPNGKLMHDKPELLKCNHCRRPVLKHAMPAHIERCLNKKLEKQRKKKEAKDARDAAARKEKSQGDSEEDEHGAKKTAGKNGGLTASKKRRATDDGEECAPSRKKKKKDEKTKAPRPKAPVDVEKQCGVELPNGALCARSLTCKSHSMGAKRAVPGRSAPYDKLLMEYQRKNQAKLQKAAFDANAPNPDDDSLPSGPVDSEEEKDAIMNAIARSWGGQPIYQPVHVPLKAKYKHNRIKSMLGAALAGRNGSGLFGTGNGTATVGSFFGSTPVAPPVDDNGIVHVRRGSVVTGARSMMAPSRKTSVASALAS